MNNNHIQLGPAMMSQIDGRRSLRAASPIALSKRSILAVQTVRQVGFAHLNNWLGWHLIVKLTHRAPVVLCMILCLASSLVADAPQAPPSNGHIE